ncbi:MAG: bifunctional enoyl-CoA hydratase/phosphate acetyltransferase [Oscillospiraceae bacterium]|nr:bifunctional enoyl-CoA hydratase/phosphate acetyltransferase [Oscillospiraceae bacterium]
MGDLVSEAKGMERKSAVAVVEAQDGCTIEAVLDAANDGLMIPLLIGDAGKIRERILEFGADAAKFEIIDSSGAEDSLQLAIEMINAGRAEALMKGGLETGHFLRAVLKKENGLIIGGRLSLAGFFETPNYHKIFAVSDMAVNTYPDLECKRVIIDNAVRLLNMLGLEKPKVAVLAAVEKLNNKMAETVDADALKRMNRDGEIRGCIVEGPISFDLATSAQAVMVKGYDSPVAGDSDLLIVPDITTGNILAKCLTGMAGARTAGVVLGARIPIMLTSRSADPSDKYYSIALAACIGARLGAGS